MKTKEIYHLLEQFAKQLGDENLIVSFSICGGKWYFSVSVYNSKSLEFSHGKMQQVAIIDASESEKNIKKVLAELRDKYTKLIKEKEHVADRTKIPIEAS